MENDSKVTMWSVWITGVLLIIFAMIAVSVSSQGTKEDIVICGERQNQIDRHIEILRMQVLQLEKVNKKRLTTEARR